jgi:uncharacterized membrane protein YkvA (DUF1232 family)
VAAEGTPEVTRRAAAAALNYLFRSLDLIPDGIEDLGFIDDAFVFRVAAARGADGQSGGDVLARLSGEVALIREFLGSDYQRLEAYVQGLDKGTARGRSVDDIAADANVRAELARDVKIWADGYQAPSFQRDPKTLVKLKSFLLTKLP